MILRFCLRPAFGFLLLVFTATSHAQSIPGCLSGCDVDYYSCHSGQEPGTCYDMRSLCIDRCDPARSNSQTMLFQQRSEPELLQRYSRNPKLTSCQKQCDEMARACGTSNQEPRACKDGRESCLVRCNDADAVKRRELMLPVQASPNVSIPKNPPRPDKP